MKEELDIGWTICIEELGYWRIVRYGDTHLVGHNLGPTV